MSVSLTRYITSTTPHKARYDNTIEKARKTNNEAYRYVLEYHLVLVSFHSSVLIKGFHIAGEASILHFYNTAMPKKRS